MIKVGKPRTNKGLAILCAKLAEEKLATDILILDLEKNENSPASYFVICTCDTEVQAKALIDFTLNVCRNLGIERPRIEGQTNKEWVLMDFFDVVFHIMKKETRNYYKLEKLWADANFIKISESGRTIKVKYEEIKEIFDDNILN